VSVRSRFDFVDKAGVNINGVRKTTQLQIERHGNTMRQAIIQYTLSQNTCDISWLETYLNFITSQLYVYTKVALVFWECIIACGMTILCCYKQSIVKKWTYKQWGTHNSLLASVCIGHSPMHPPALIKNGCMRFCRSCINDWISYIFSLISSSTENSNCVKSVVMLSLPLHE